MKEFEYCTVDLHLVYGDKAAIEKLNKLGADGWELVVIFPFNHSYARHYFKREIKPELPRVTIEQVLLDIQSGEIRASARVRMVLKEAKNWQEKTYLDECVLPSRNFGRKSRAEWAELYKHYFN